MSNSDGDLIAAIYDAIIEPSGWDDILKRIVEATKSVSGGLSIHLANAAHLSASHNIDPFYANAYVQTWYRQNPISLLLETLAPGELRTATHITQTGPFRASAFFNEFVRPQGCADVVGVGLLRTPIAVGFLALQRSPDAVWVEPPEWQLIETLTPHLKRACDLGMRLSVANATANSLGTAVAAAGFAVFLLTGDCRVVFANTKAEDLVRRGIWLNYQFGRLAATCPALTARLHALTRQAASPGTGKAHAAGSIKHCRGENCPPLHLHVIPLAARRAVIYDFDSPSAAVFIVDPDAGFRAQIQRFAEGSCLTGTETRVLAEIIAGNGIGAAATQLKMTELTVRSHTKHIFSKTGTNRQTELIRRFFETALIGSPDRG